MTALTLELPDEVLAQLASRVAAILATTATSAAPEPRLTVEQAANHLGISKSQLYSLCSTRQTSKIPLTKDGSRSFFKASELDRWRSQR
jgi:excisionase family DNA binding protein